MIIDVEERVAKAREYFHSGCNCSQSVALAFSDITGLSEKDLERAATGFGGGFGRMREVCGAVSGMTMLAGFIRPVADRKDIPARKENYALVQDFAEKFRQENGSIICRELLGLAHNVSGAASGAGIGAGVGASVGANDPTPSERTPEYYHKRPCEEIVGIAARIVAEYLTEHQESDLK